MPEFSLIVATKDRTSELARLIKSVEAQDAVDYELIIVDQNDDDRLASILQKVQHNANIFHVRSTPGVSRARNVGLDRARGQIIAFPDDDCWYPPGLLKNVSDWVTANPSYDMLSVNSLDEKGVRSGNRWIQNSCNLNVLNLYRTSVGYSYFVRATCPPMEVRFDESIGPGSHTRYLGGEDSDYVLAALKAGTRGRFEAKWHVGHPLKDIRNSSVDQRRAYIYGAGMGFVQRKHRLTFLWLGFLVLDLVRAAGALLVGRRVPSRLWYWHARGVIDGFLRRES
jgi:glycosyltransferase involved in cell wall biosynthesis